MGGFFHNDQRPFQHRLALSFVRIVDRQVNTQANRFTFEHAGPQTIQVLAASQDATLLSSAAQDFAAFAATAANTLSAWSSLSTPDRAVTWELYRLGDAEVLRWAEIHQEHQPGKVHNKGPFLSAAEDVALSSAAKAGLQIFTPLAIQTFGDWWGTISGPDQAAFFSNYAET